MSKHRRKHKDSDHHKKRDDRSNLLLFVFIGVFLIIISAGTYYFLVIANNSDKAQVSNEEIILNQDLIENTEKTGALKQYTGTEFKDLYNSYAYPNTEYIAEDAIITGDSDTDALIRKMAEDRGYIRRSAPVQNTFIEVEPGMSLQERAAEPWADLKESATKDNIDLFLTAAYRSADEQRTIFLERIGSIGLSQSLIISGSYNDKLDDVLASTAIPGYSRHHTGYTIDIGCGNDPNTAFEFTVCFDWLSAENYKNAKTHGWIPSYPEGAGQQGPEPETWEYVWVGLETVTE